ncbi:hypothetical protein CJF30_00011194 [Rutstroemia sp. NJR-2017a BBW]|nr:hypothetical protein CJF30_00011194 [Rutstroemia sp. NJR-2017a BBW]
MPASKPISIAIVGGGISGLCLAIGLLHRSQHKISIFEASSAFAEIGAGLALGPNAQRALRLISHAAEQAFRDYATGNSSPTLSKACSHTIAYRGLIPMDNAKDVLGKYADDAYVWCGNGGMVMTYPINSGQVLNVVAACERSSWNEKKYVINSTVEQLSKDFENWGGRPREIIKLLDKPMLWALLDHLPASQYHSRNIVIMGDAAHATTPFQGAGAGQAIEDALVLSELLGRVQCLRDLEPALAAYDTVRRPRTQKIVQTSRDTMKLFAFTDGKVNGDAEK